MAAIATSTAFHRAAAAPAAGRRGSAPSRLAAAPRPSCRGRRCCARVMAFRWGEVPDTNNTTTSPSSSPTPPSLTPSHTNSAFGREEDPSLETDFYMSRVDAALEGMRREERVRDLQRTAAEAFEGAKARWNQLPDKRSVLVGGAGLLVAAYLGSAVLSAVDRVPLVPGLLQTVGFGFSCWFWYRFLLFAEGRRDLEASLALLRRNVSERMDGLADKTIDAHPNAGSGETGAGETARQLVGRMAARHTRQQQQQQQQQAVAPLKDDGSWVDEPDTKAGEGDVGLSEGYVAGLLQELDERSRSPSPGPGAGAGGGRAPPAIFAFIVSDLAAGVWDAEPGAEESSAVGGGTPPPGASSSPSSPSSSSEGTLPASSTPTPRSDASTGIAGGSGSVGEGGHAMADLDPCLGWDVEACRASGHLKLGEPDTSKLDSLAETAFRQAKEAMQFSHHVDEVLHEPTSHNQAGQASLESMHLEGEYGRAAGTMEREAMEDMAAKNPDAMKPHLKSSRQPSQGEEAGL
ncbi:hypothetical protein PLESTB_000849700 [Pleodorina starrii]|uniref:Cyanobacterial aminoacyl-tRNA synthetase CAAD domain-containing protein n=1 Tax=Pleodorina starrii TaxID=330485 RepID=A0A9W6BLJ1_9CHLO|nr:hypothetical protein PLESTM_001443600 [Pleodorina starrii]GLC54309.1 hypothetical protein PLESTB_000849700 [Pleodorina starrii]GLC71960.1 hypothetical protein PLESTF_001189300 [Pleodorina starrii]